MKFILAEVNDGTMLAEIRAEAMKPSLIALGRYDQVRVRARFINSFEPNDTYKIVDNNEIVGFFVVKKHCDHHNLEHLYLLERYQNSGIGSMAIGHIISNAKQSRLPLKLGALKGSRSNEFYQKHGFVKTHDLEFDNHYQLKFDC